jgi:hypothetical protein
MIQDNAADWKNGAVTMHEVYRWAKLTLVA